MRQVAAVMILVALFAVLVGSRFKASDGEKLAAVSRLGVAKVRGAMPPTLRSHLSSAASSGSRP